MKYTMFDGYLKVRVSLYIWVTIWINAILNHVDDRGIIPKYEGSHIVYRHEWYHKQNVIKHPNLIGYQKYVKFLLEIHERCWYPYNVAKPHNMISFHTHWIDVYSSLLLNGHYKMLVYHWTLCWFQVHKPCAPCQSIDPSHLPKL